MKISEIIKGFEELKYTYGDANVFIPSQNDKNMIDEFYIGKDAVIHDEYDDIIISPRIEIN